MTLVFNSSQNLNHFPDNLSFSEQDWDNSKKLTIISNKDLNNSGDTEEYYELIKSVSNDQRFNKTHNIKYKIKRIDDDKQFKIIAQNGSMKYGLNWVRTYESKNML